MTIRTDRAQTPMDHEQIVAGRYRWWGVYLIREKRRLRGISEAVQAEEAAAALQQQAPPEPGSRDGNETPEELLTRVDAELELAAAVVELAPAEAENTEESAGTLIEDNQTPDTSLRRRLAGRTRLLASKQDESEDEDF